MKLNSVILLKVIGAFLVMTVLMACEKEKSKADSSFKQEELSQSVVDLVYPLLDTENSRWFFFSSACRPFGMVNLSPDTETNGAWGSGYRYKTDTIRGFSHIHAWQMAGLSVMPVTISKANKNTFFTDFHSKFNHQDEKVMPGYQFVNLERYNITAEITSTTRVGFHKYTFSGTEDKGILFNLNTILGPCENIEGVLNTEDTKTLSGSFVMTPTKRRPKPLKVFFKVKLNTPVSALIQDSDTGNYMLHIDKSAQTVLMKIAISYTSIENATHNLEAELPHWDFDKVVSASKTNWNDMLGRIKVAGGSKTDQQRFYTDLWHALQGRRIISDANGAYPDNTEDTFKIGQLPINELGKPKFNHYNSDSFWGAQWTINTLWGLAYPDIKEEFTYSLMQYYKDGGMIPRGPSGGNYTYVMTGASSTPFIVSAIQKGIVTDSLESIYQALKKNHFETGIMAKAGYEHNTFIGGGLKHYLEKGYVPYPIPEGHGFGLHQDGSSQTMEYAYQDWTLAQLAKKLNHEDDYNNFIERSKNYKHVFNTTSGWMNSKKADGSWCDNFDPYQYEHGFIESNAAQSTWFVPHDIEGLAELMGGKEQAVKKLQTQFETAKAMKFTSGSSHDVELHPEYSRVPINYGNQPSIQTAFIFNKLGRPDLTQFWSRAVVKETFSGLSPKTGYNGDEDQGLMGSLNVLMKIGLFQMNGGTEANPEYQIGSPIFNEVHIALHPEYYKGKTFTIKALHNNSDNIYVKDIKLNKSPLKDFKLSHEAIVNGGELVLNMTNTLDK